MVDWIYPPGRDGIAAAQYVLENENEYDWSADANDYDAELNAYENKNDSEGITGVPGVPSISDFRERSNSAENITEKRKGRDSVLRETAFETLSRLSNQFPPVVEEGADTLVWLGEPPQQPGQDDYEYGYVRRQFQMPYLMKSATLKRLNSPKFNKFLGPMSARTERRLKKHAVHKLVKSTAQIKYYIDLSPVVDDEEAMVQLTQLTVPSGALSWHQTAELWNVDTELVCGRDDLDIPPRPVYTYQHGGDNFHETDIENLEKKLDSIANELKTSEEKLSEVQKKIKEDKPKVNPYNLPLEEEYTQLRHHTAIARLLHAIAGNDPKLNSAAKAWTFCMLANYFECASYSGVGHWVISWLLQSGNINFIQSNPGIAYRLGMATQSSWLVRCTFAILVGEQAISKDMKTLPQGRHCYKSKQLECLDDDDINRVDHAAEALSRRVRALIDELAVFPGIWTYSDPESAQLSRLRDVQVVTNEDQQLLAQVLDHLRNYLRRIIYMTMSDSYPFDNKSITPFRASVDFSSYTQVPRSLRFLTQFHWEVLHKEELHRDYLDTPNNHNIWNNTQEVLQREGLLLDESIPYVSKQTLYDAIRALNLSISYSRNFGLNRIPSSGEKRPDADQWLAPPQTDNPNKRSKLEIDDPTQHVIEASVGLALRPRTIGQGQVLDQNIEAGSSKTTSLADDKNSVTTEDDWEEILGSDAEKKAVRFLPTRQEPGEEEEQPLSADPSSSSPKTTVRPSSSSGIVAKLKDMDFESGPSDCEQDTAAWDQLERRTRGAFPRAPLTSSQQVADHVLSTMKLAPSQQSASNSSDRASPPSSTKGVYNFGSSEANEPPAFAWTPKSQVDSVGREKALSSDGGIIAPEGLLRDFSQVLSKKLDSLFIPGYVADGSLDFDIPVDNINTLLCLGEDEYKYLPLWAGGFDDGSGGVFDDGAEVPDAPDVADGGFRGGAMGIIRGIGSSMGGSMAGSEFEDLGTEVGVSTVGKASRYATDGTATETVMSLDD